MGIEPERLLDLHGFSLERRVPGGIMTLLENIDLRLDAGQWVAVLGANGSGKSSLLEYLAGEDSPLQASVVYMAQDPDDQLIAATVRGEITLGHRGLDPLPSLREFSLEDVADLDPRLLSAGQKQRLTLATAVQQHPRLLICDEPTALQDSTQSVWVLDRLDSWRRETGRGLLTATCDRREAVRADWLVILERGRVLVQGPSADLLDSAAVADLLGRREVAPVRPCPRCMGDSPVLQLQGVACDFLGPGGGFHGVDLTVTPGQRVGITGPNGCGKSTLLAVCAGLRPPDRGRVDLAGRTLYARGVRDLDHGLAMLAPQFPEYMFCRTTVQDELAMGPLPAGVVAGDFLAELGLGREILTRNPHDLSSGQRRRLAVGLTAHSGRPLLLLDEPTAALDRCGRRQMVAILDGTPSTGALIIASHDRELLEILGCRVWELQSGEMGLAASERGC